VSLLRRWFKFNFVGLVGIAVQFAGFALYQRWMSYLYATALAVETAVLHNFIWHERFTWKDRPDGVRESLSRLLRFHLANGVVSIAGNAALMWLLVGRLGLPRYGAMAIAIAACSLVNFALGEWFVFRRAS
jgi:putative flippase GtrA